MGKINPNNIHNKIAYSKKIGHQHHHVMSGNIKRTQKLKSPLQIDIKTIDRGEVKIGEEFRLVAHIHSTKPINDVVFDWRIPDNIRVISGTLSTHFNKLNAGDKHSLELVLVADNDKQEIVHLVGKTNSGAQQVTNSSQYSIFSQDKVIKRIEDTSKRSTYYNEEHHQHKVYK